MNLKSTILKDIRGEVFPVENLWKASATILFCRHLESQSCRKELKKLWDKINLSELQEQRVVIIYGNGDSRSIPIWESLFGGSFIFLRDVNFEVFNYYKIYSGLISFGEGGKLNMKIPLSLLEKEPPKPYKFLKSQEPKLLSKL